MTARASHVWRTLGAEDGQSLVEFALVLVPLLVVIMGILWFGRALNYSSDQTHLANEAARFAAVNVNPGCSAGSGCTTSQLTTWVLNQIDSGELKNGSTDVSSPAAVSICFPSNPATGTSGQIGDPVEVQIKSTFQWLPILNLGVTKTDIVGTAWMRIEQAPTNYSTTGACT